MNHKETCDRRTGAVLGEDKEWDAMINEWMGEKIAGIFEARDGVSTVTPRDRSTTCHPKVTSAQVKKAIDICHFYNYGVMTICILTLKNGYKVTGESACVSPENYDQALGEKLARKNAVDKVWNLEGYLLRERLCQEQQPKQPQQPQQPQQKSETGWLIEWVPENNDSPKWLMSALAGFIPIITGTAEHALRFARKQDAETFVSLNPELCFGSVVTEHMWED